VTPRRAAIFLDRDGVLNRAVVRDGRPHPPADIHELEIPDDAREALRRLRCAGFALVCVTNQPDVARGAQRREVVEMINAALAAELPLDDVFVCYHDEADNCACRKPKPGLLIQAAEKHKLDLFSSYLIGDRWKDVEAGRRAGCVTILVGSGWSETPVGPGPDRVTDSLAEAAEWILTRCGATEGVS
jgi:D-glycero-D-manno-heptose 1,7-bisphosphate phosphatase